MAARKPPMSERATSEERAVHVLGFVDWDVLNRRRRERRATRSYYFGSQKKWVLKAGHGGTAWFVTTNPGVAPRTFHLAFRLVDCKILEKPPADLRGSWGPHMIVARNWGASDHYPFNDVGKLLPRLRFADGKQLDQIARRYWGTRLVSFPVLTWKSVLRLEAYAHQLLTDRSIFLSYSRRDAAEADFLVQGLERRGIQVHRDVDHLVPGDRWRDELTKFAQGSDIVLVLTTPAAARSEEVHSEVRWAVESMSTDGPVRRIMPLYTAPSALRRIPGLVDFQGLPYRRSEDFLDQLSESLRQIPRRRRMGWSTVDGQIT